MFYNDNDNKDKPGFNAQAFKHAIGMIESSGGKHLSNSASSAAGKYHFLYNSIKHDPSMKGISKQEFINRPDLQEEIMDKALAGELQDFPYGEKYANKLQRDYQSKYNVNQLSALVHFLGPGNTRKFLKDPENFKVPGKSNISGHEYLERFDGIFKQHEKDNAPKPAIVPGQPHTSLPSPPRDIRGQYPTQPIDNTRVANNKPAMDMSTPEYPSQHVYDLDLNGTNSQNEANNFKDGGDINPTDPPTKEERQGVLDYIKKMNAESDMQKAIANQPQMRASDPRQSFDDKALEVLLNPLTAAGYAARGKALPDNFSRGSRNPLDYATDVVNPVQWLHDAKELVGGITGLDAGRTLEGALGVLPMPIPKGVSKGAGKSVNRVLGEADPAGDAAKELARLVPTQSKSTKKDLKNHARQLKDKLKSTLENIKDKTLYNTSNTLNELNPFWNKGARNSGEKQMLQFSDPANPAVLKRYENYGLGKKEMEAAALRMKNYQPKDYQRLYEDIVTSGFSEEWKKSVLNDMKTSNGLSFGIPNMIYTDTKRRTLFGKKRGKEINSVEGHELSHLTDRNGKELTPEMKSDLWAALYLDKETFDNLDRGNARYLGDPTEIRARISQARHSLKKKPEDVFTAADYDKIEKEHGWFGLTDYFPGEVNKEAMIKVINKIPMVAGAAGLATAGASSQSNEFKEGGQMDGSGYDASQLVTVFEGGGTHEENPYGGIAQGEGKNGKPNLVEEGETKWKDYIFSNAFTTDGLYTSKEGEKSNVFEQGGELSNSNCGGPGQPPCDEKYFQTIRDSRQGHVRKNEDGSESTHLMADNNKDKAFPTLFRNEDGSWDDFGNNHDAALKRATADNEIYSFNNKEDLTKFAREGSWKESNSFKQGGNLKSPSSRFLKNAPLGFQIAGDILADPSAIIGLPSEVKSLLKLATSPNQVMKIIHNVPELTKGMVKSDKNIYEEGGDLSGPTDPPKGKKPVAPDNSQRIDNTYTGAKNLLDSKKFKLNDNLQSLTSILDESDETARRKARTMSEYEYYHPKVEEGISTGDPRQDFLYNNQYLMDIPLVGGYIKDKIKEKASKSGGRQHMTQDDIDNSDSAEESMNYTGSSGAPNANSPRLLDQYFSEDPLLEPATHSPKSDYYPFLKTYSARGKDWEKTIDVKGENDWDESPRTRIDKQIQEVLQRQYIKNNGETDIDSEEASKLMFDQFMKDKKTIYSRRDDNSYVSRAMDADLGGHGIGIGYDEDSGYPYMSVSDAWDFEPRGYTKKWGTDNPDGIEDEEKRQLSKIQSSIMHKAGHPYKLYDRFYINPSTGKYMSSAEMKKLISENKKK